MVDAALRYELASPELGFEFLDAIDDALERIEEHPELGERVPVAHVDAEVRRWVLRRFPFVLYYEPVRLRVVAISHSHKRPFYWARRLGL